jgi:hypothetical protein
MPCPEALSESQAPGTCEPESASRAVESRNSSLLIRVAGFWGLRASGVAASRAVESRNSSLPIRVAGFWGPGRIRRGQPRR